MDNLEIASRQVFKHNKNIGSDFQKVNIEDSLSCFITNCNKLCICEHFDSIKTLPLNEELCQETILLKFLHSWQVVFIATTKNLYIYEPKEERTVTVQSFPNSLVHASWNPNENFMILLDNLGNLYGLNFEVNLIENEYHFVEAIRAHLDDYVPNSVYVGWGSHNTQFKGAKKKVEEQIEEIEQEYSSPRISWRGNGEQFVINYWKDKRRHLKVFSSSLKPLFLSEQYVNLQPLASFKGQGNFIACTAKHNDQNKIVIFEKNCLVKSEFFVPENRGEVKQLQYHPDLHILAVYSENATFGFLNIYLYSNAKWYLKQQLFYPENNKLFAFHWATYLDKTMCTLNVLTTNASERILFRIVINRYPENGLVAVIDGPTVDFTRFFEQIIPPPMASVTLSFDKPVNRICFIKTLNVYQFLFSDDTVRAFSYENRMFTECSIVNLPQITLDGNGVNSDIIYISEKIINNVLHEFCLDRKQDLLVDKEIACSNVLSMFIHKDYLLFTHASCKLYCIRLTPTNISNLNWNLNKFYSREVEPGAKIVCVTSNSEIVLEMPRGNLETITCRAISIDTVEHLLAQNHWNHAIKQIRHQRLNWNLLIDLNPQRFLEHISNFLSAVKSVAFLNTIISEFSNEDCLQTMYKQCFERDIQLDNYNKIEVLAKILVFIAHLNPVSNLVSVVTLQAKHFSVKSALMSVLTAFKLNEREICKKAVFQILLQTHAKTVICEAYTLYNIDFMRFVYTCCSEDPRSFEPELEQLEGVDPLDLRFRMNVLAKNYKAATKFLIRCDKYDEKYCTDFITKYATETVAYRSISPKHSNFKAISRLYAKHLARKGKYNEAGFTLERASLYNDALQEYKEALNWQRVVSLLETLKIDEPQRNEILLELASDLVNEKRTDEAVVIYEHYLHHHETAIEVLSEKKMFQQALSLAEKYDCTNIIEKNIKPAIVKYREDLLFKINDFGTKFFQYTTRLLLIRQKQLHTLKYFNDDDAVENDDLHSEYGSLISSRGSSAGTRSSRMSTLSSRNRRKQEKKKIDIKEGGVYEDIALIRQLYLLAIDIFSCGQEVKEVCLTLHDDESIAFSAKLHNTLSDIQEKVKSDLPRIWSDIFLNAPDSTDPEVLSVVKNRSELDVEFRSPPPAEKLLENWTLLTFARNIC